MNILFIYIVLYTFFISAIYKLKICTKDLCLKDIYSFCKPPHLLNYL